jgi:hypothetical protein
MLENIKNTQVKVTEVNMQYMDVSTKLTMLQNHQLLMQLEYQSQQLEELTKNNEILDKKIFEMKKDLEIHKEVELSLAEKNKKLKKELLKLKREEENSENDNNNISDDKKGEPSERNDGKKYSVNLKMINLEQKIINLEKKLNQKKKDFNVLKDKYEYIENVLKNYETKYLGIFNFLEDSLQNFYMDDELKSNQEVNLHIDELKKGNFSLLTKEEQYSTLVILMKYLMPLIDQTNLNKGDIINKVAVNFHFPNVNNNKFKERKIKKIFVQKQNDVFRSISVENIYNKNSGNKKVLPPLSVNSKNMARVGSGFGPIYKIKKIKFNSSGVSNTTNVI